MASPQGVEYLLLKYGPNFELTEVIAFRLYMVICYGHFVGSGCLYGKSTSATASVTCSSFHMLYHSQWVVILGIIKKVSSQG
jgi:hypothetical protein